MNENAMKNNIKLVAVDIDGTFVRSDYTYNIPRFKQILSRMKHAGCNFVVASGNQYYQLRDLFPGYYDELSFVAENGAFVKDQILKFAPTVPEDLYKGITGRKERDSESLGLINPCKGHESS